MSDSGVSFGFYFKGYYPASPKETFRRARARLKVIGYIEPPLTFRQLRNVYRHARTPDAPIFYDNVASVIGREVAYKVWSE